jgi:hypothetical protein
MELFGYGKGESMGHNLRWIVILGTLGLGVGSLLATSEPPEVLSLSLGILSGSQVYDEDIEVCSDEDLLVQWSVSSGEATLSATPSGNLEPLLENKAVPQTGEMTIVIKGDVTLTLFNKTSSGATAERQISISLSSESYCEVLRFLPAQYQGVLNQTLPEVATLERSLHLSIIDKRIEAWLSNLGEGVYLNCNVMAAQILRCTESSEPNAFTLEGKISATTFSGDYSGIQKGSGFEVVTLGSFEFIKDAEGE